MAPSREETVAVLVILGVLGVALYRFIRWVIETPRTPDPWGEEAEQAVNSEEALPVCHRCLTPQRHTGWFCPECGAIVGPYANYMPYIYVFSEGEVLRAGVTAHLRRNALIVCGFIFLSLGVFSYTGVFAVVLLPIYWFLLFRNLRQGPRELGADA